VNSAPANGPSELRVQSVSLDIAGVRALHAVTTAFSVGAPVAITGPSGCGKSALCFVLAGAVEPTEGSILTDGRPFSPAAREDVGLILQVHGLVSGLTAVENVSLPLQARRVQSDDVRDAAMRSLALVGLARDGERVIDELSGGEQQRVGIARALAGDPHILIADEPTAELDPDNRENVLSLLLERGSHQRIVVVASDDPVVVARFPRVLELDGGRVRKEGPAPAPA
jgi:putative ABC transport system ATP-binding protein